MSSNSSESTPHVQFTQPSCHYAPGAVIACRLLPSLGHEYEIKSGRSLGTDPIRWNLHGNSLVIRAPGIAGSYFIRVRARKQGSANWSAWSPPLWFHVRAEQAQLRELREADHKLSMALERAVDSTVTLMDPSAVPPNYEKVWKAKWFPTYSYEGATPLFNEIPVYYRDPLAYLELALNELKSTGAVFLRWSDDAVREEPSNNLEIVLQFDVDGGPKSMGRILTLASGMGVCGNLMVHRRGHYWYPYEITDASCSWLESAQRSGWEVGYHNNALSRVVGKSCRPLQSSEVKLAGEMLREDVLRLRQLVPVQVLTHHGGNIPNRRVPIPADLNISCVDRDYAPQLWKSIDSMFSDGGFTARPQPLLDHVRSLKSGRHFLRLHPFKYGNYEGDPDVPRRDSRDEKNVHFAARERDWLEQRQVVRAGTRTLYPRLNTPISSRFSKSQEETGRVKRLRGRREERFLEEFPYSEGDPRVYWWRMIRAFLNEPGIYLNVGALPSSDKTQGNEFLRDGVVMHDIDLNSERLPTYCGDIVTWSAGNSERFSGTLLFGLPYFSDPFATIRACQQVTIKGGCGLFAFPAETHLTRGGLWNPVSRPVWTPGSNPIPSPSWNTQLWSFDHSSLAHLFGTWSSYRQEFWSHYWFVVAYK